jgi:hypothetical protein
MCLSVKLRAMHCTRYQIRICSMPLAVSVMSPIEAFLLGKQPKGSQHEKIRSHVKVAAAAAALEAAAAAASEEAIVMAAAVCSFA